jgi:ATP-binding cassette subfamily B protein
MRHPVSVARERGLRDLVRWMSPRRKAQVGLLFALMLAGAVAELMAIGAVLPFLRLIVAPQMVLAEPRLDAVRAAFGWNSATDLVVPAALLLVTCAVGAAGVRLLLAWASQRFIYRLGYDMDAELFRRTVRQPYQVFVNRNGSEILAGFDKINILANTMLLPVMMGITSAVIAACIVALLFWIDPFTAAVTTGSMSLIYLGIALVSRASLRLISRERARLATARVKAVQEGLGGLRDIILDRSHHVHERRFARINDRFRNMGARAAITATTPRFVAEAAGIALIGSLAIYFTHRPGGILAAVPVLGALVLGAQRLLPLVQTSYHAAIQYLAARHALADVLGLMAGPMLEPAAPSSGSAMPFSREIALIDLGFAYADGAAALTGIDLVITRGDRIGIVGRSGSGKSTLVDIITGLLEPGSGSILIDGVPLTPERVGDWQAQIAHVPQTIFLADDSVAANIALGDPGDAIDTARMEDAARRAQIHDFVTGLPQGYATAVGDRGIRLSGGQRQRIGIARALYKRADVLILDEATSALDDGTEAAVMAQIDALGRAATVILIAHRLSTLRSCTTICRLAGGRIVEHGDYATVLGRGDDAEPLGDL